MIELNHTPLLNRIKRLEKAQYLFDKKQAEMEALEFLRPDEWIKNLGKVEKQKDELNYRWEASFNKFTHGKVTPKGYQSRKVRIQKVSSAIGKKISGKLKQFSSLIPVKNDFDIFNIELLKKAQIKERAELLMEGCEKLCRQKKELIARSEQTLVKFFGFPKKFNFSIKF